MLRSDSGSRSRRLARSIAGDHAQITQLFCIRIPAFCSLGRCFGSRLNGRGAFFCSRFDQCGLMGSICYGSLVPGDKFGVGNSGGTWLIHKDPIVHCHHASAALPLLTLSPSWVRSVQNAAGDTSVSMKARRLP